MKINWTAIWQAVKNAVRTVVEQEAREDAPVLVQPDGEGFPEVSREEMRWEDDGGRVLQSYGDEQFVKELQRMGV